MALDPKAFEELKLQLQTQQGAQAPTPTAPPQTGGGLGAEEFEALKLQLQQQQPQDGSFGESFADTQAAKRQERIEQGLPVGMGERVKPTFVGGALRDIARPVARIGATLNRPFVGGFGMTPASLEEATLKAPLFGDIKPLPGPLDVRTTESGKETRFGPGQAIGAGLEIGATIAPGGGAAAARGLRAGLTPAKSLLGRAAQKVTPFARGQAVAGGAAGAGIELQEGDTSVGEVLGAGALGSALGGVLGSELPGRAIRGVARTPRVIGEAILGKTTGVGDDVIREAGEIVIEGGARKEAFQEALRGRVTPDQIVDTGKNALRELKEVRRNEFKDGLSKIDRGQVLDINPIRTSFDEALKDFRIKVDPDGTVNFRGSGIANNADREAIQNVVDELATFGNRSGDNTVNSVDDLRFFLQESFTRGKKSGAFVEKIRKSVREELGEQVTGFNDMQKRFADSTEFINEVEKFLSLGDTASRDTAFRKLVSSLRNNNEMRQRVVRELDEITGGALTSQIVGQQLSETVSRGLIGSLGTTGAVAAVASGGISYPFLIGLLGLSPRFVGEAINALGLSVRVRRALTSAINNIGDGIGKEAIEQLRRQAEIGIIRSTQ